MQSALGQQVCSAETSGRGSEAALPGVSQWPLVEAVMCSSSQCIYSHPVGPYACQEQQLTISLPVQQHG